MESLINWSNRSIARTSLSFKRYLFNKINWEAQLIVIIGSRGVGKTTIMLQHAKELKVDLSEILYASLDNIYFSNHSLISLAENFAQKGGKFLFLDEIQKYNNWSVEIKNIYDNFPELKIVLSGSSTTEILKSEGDLSRRALFYKLGGLSFREFLKMKNGLDFEKITLEEILKNHTKISLDLSQQFKPIKEFTEYLQQGYYPFFKEDIAGYHQKIRQIINTVIEVDIPAVYAIDYAAVLKLKKMLSIISEIVPFKPNVSKLSTAIGISRESFIRYLSFLEKADIINLLYSDTKGMSQLRKPEKIYLQNPNIAFSFSPSANIGSIRESIFINQLSMNHEVAFTAKGDFLIDEKFTFEIGGKSKGNAQISNVKNAWVVADNIESSVGNKIPLWLFGMIY